MERCIEIPADEWVPLTSHMNYWSDYTVNIHTSIGRAPCFSDRCVGRHSFYACEPRCQCGLKLNPFMEGDDIDESTGLPKPFA